MVVYNLLFNLYYNLKDIIHLLMLPAELIKIIKLKIVSWCQIMIFVLFSFFYV